MKNNGKKFNNFLNNFKNSICKKCGYWWILPAIIVFATIICVGVIGGQNKSITDGLNVGIDFEGGTMISVNLGEQSFVNHSNYETNKEIIEKTIESFGVKISYTQTSEGTSKDNSLLTFRYKNIDNNDTAISNKNKEISNAVKKIDWKNADGSQNTYLIEKAKSPKFITAESIGKTASNELIKKALLALLISTILILIYIIIRFEPVSAVAAIITMLHDVLIMFCLTVLFRIQINSSYVAAAITIITYAINNTIIVFDRCREKIKPMKGSRNINFYEIGDSAISDTFKRQVYTTFTTLVTVAFLAILGGAAIREFTVPIILGLFVGFYSTMFIATPLWSKMAFAYQDLRNKKGGAIVYKKSNDLALETTNQSVDLEDFVDEDDDFSGEQIKPKASRQNIQKPIKYKKKNTQFKKKR